MEIHTVNAGNECRRKKNHGCDRKNFDDFIFFQINPTHDDIGKEIDLFKQLLLFREAYGQNITGCTVQNMICGGA